MRPGTRTIAIQSYGDGSVPDAIPEGDGRCRCSALPIGVMRSTSVSGPVHRHFLTAYRRRHGRPPRLSPLSLKGILGLKALIQLLDCEF